MNTGSNQKIIFLQELLQIEKIKTSILEFSTPTRSAQEAADSIGCSLTQIAKSLIFKTTKSQKPLLIITCGANLIDGNKVEKIIGEPIEKPDAEFVRNQTGYTIGGVPPIGHKNIKTIIDKDLLKNEYIWAAAGTPNAVFRMTTHDLQRVIKAQIEDVKQEK